MTAKRLTIVKHIVNLFAVMIQYEDITLDDYSFGKSKHLIESPPDILAIDRSTIVLGSSLNWAPIIPRDASRCDSQY